MCLIIDTNMFSLFLDPADKDMEPIRKWIHHHGRLAYSPNQTYYRGD